MMQIILIIETKLPCGHEDSNLICTGLLVPASWNYVLNPIESNIKIVYAEEMSTAAHADTAANSFVFLFRRASFVYNPLLS